MGLSGGKDTALPTVTIEDVLKQLVLALKCLQLYPSDHKSSLEALDELSVYLHAYLKTSAQLAFFVTKDGLLVDGQLVGPNNLALRSLSQRLYRLKLEAVAMTHSIDRGQLADLLAIFCMDAEDVLACGGVGELLWQKQVKAVSIREANLRVSQSGPVEKPETADARVERERASLTRTKMLLTGKSNLTSRDHADVKHFLSRRPAELAAFFAGLEDANQETSKSRASPALAKIDTFIEGELDEDQAFLYQNVAEALLLLDEPLKSELANTIFAGAAKQERSSFHGLIQHLNPEEVAGLLGFSSVVEELPEPDFLRLLGRLELDPARFKNLVANPEKQGAIEKLPQKAVREAEEVISQPAVDLSGAEIGLKALGAIVAADDIDLKELLEEAALIDAEQLELTAVGNLIDVLADERDMQKLSRIIGFLHKRFTETVSTARMAVAVAILSGIRTEFVRRKGEPEALNILKDLLREAATTAHIEELLSFVANSPNMPIEQIFGYFELLNAHGTTVLLDILAVEKQQSRRRLLCQILAATAQKNIGNLGKKVLDDRWYLVRNVAMIMGQLRDENALPYLQTAATHRDPRVRAEAIRGLAGIGKAALPTLLDLLNSRNKEVQIDALKALERVGYPEVTASLLAMLRKPDILGRRFEIKLWAIKALRRQKSKAVKRQLLRIADRRHFFFKAKHKKLREAAEAVLKNFGSVS